VMAKRIKEGVWYCPLYNELILMEHVTAFIGPDVRPVFAYLCTDSMSEFFLRHNEMLRSELVYLGVL